ncbi:MAG: chemotaxis protein CheW [Myxococcaceae bacterium]
MAGPVHLVFFSGSACYAVPAVNAQEIVALGEVTSVPNGAGHLLGVFAHRGEIIPLIGLEELRGGTSKERSSRALIIRTSGGPYAVTANRLAGVFGLEKEPGPLSDDGVGRHLRGPVKAGPHEALAIDIEGLFAFLSASA